jgi:gliding motility-associated protein GldM
MAGGKETPRQRMIGILYLVLLGLIALNVPEGLLDAFKNIKNSLNTSSNNVTTGIDNTYSAFEKTKLKDQPERAKEPYRKAKEASKATGELITYIDQLSAQLVTEGGGINPEIDDVDGRDNLDISPRVMIENKNAEKLRQKIDVTRTKLLSLLTEKEKTGIQLSLVAVDPPKGRDGQKTWEDAYFGEGIPLGATLTTLAKIKADTKNAENEVVKKILGEVDQAVVNLDKFAAVAVAPSSYVIAGQPYTAEVFLTASDSKSNPTITANGSTLQVTDGKGKYSVNTGAEGVFTWVGHVTVKQADGTSKTYDTNPQTYQVARPSAVVSPDKMNVLYIGVPNPISVSAPGIPKEKLRVSISNGSVSGSNGHYTATVSNAGQATVSVSGEIAPGKSQVLGSTLFRVKRIPDPKPQFAGKSSGSTSAANLRGQDRVFAKLENFEFEAGFTVTRFTLIILKPRQDVISYTTTGAELSGQMKAAMASVTPGTTIVIQDIMAVGPDGTQRGLDAIVLRAN